MNALLELESPHYMPDHGLHARKLNSLFFAAQIQITNKYLGCGQRYTYRVLQTIQMKVILLWVWAERAVLGRAKTALKFKYEI